MGVAHRPTTRKEVTLTPSFIASTVSVSLPSLAIAFGVQLDRRNRAMPSLTRII